MKIITDITKKKKYDYFFHKFYEAGIILEKWEIKSIKKNGFNITGSYVNINNTCNLINSYIKPIRKKIKNDEFQEKRKRTLLLKKKEIISLKTKINEKKITLIPIKIYWKNKFIKIELALSSGKKNYDKRHILKEKTIKKIIKDNNIIY